MRCAIIAIFVSVPLVIITWVVSRGIYAEPPGAETAFLSGAVADGEPAAMAVAKPMDPDAVLRGLFGTPLAGAKVDGDLQLYDPDGLFEYIDGAAPIFIERGFRKLAAAEMKTATGGELTCDVYDMQSPENAGSIFDKEQPPTSESIEIGDAARSAAMLVVFRKGRYYAKLTAFDGPGEEALPAVARALSEAMP